MLNLHADNSIYNTVLSKAYQKGQRGRVGVELYYGGEVFTLEPDEVIEKLKGVGVNVSRRTLYNWEKWGLIPEPTFRNSRTTEYPDHAWVEAFASHRLMHGPKRMAAKQVKQDREKALGGDIKALLREAFFEGRLEHSTAIEWRSLRDKLLQGYGPGDDVTYKLRLEREGGAGGPVRERLLLEKRNRAKEQTPEEMRQVLDHWAAWLDGLDGQK